jgi:hypothetical protein
MEQAERIATTDPQFGQWILGDESSIVPGSVVVRSDASSPVRSDRFPRHQERKRQGVYVNRFTPQKTRTSERNSALIESGTA